MAIEKARQGFLVGIFPEGRINTTTDFMLSVRPGAIMIALRAGVPVIPVSLEGSPYRDSTLSPFFMTADVQLVVGKSYDLVAAGGSGDARAGREQQVMLMLNAVDRIARLAGVEGFVPRIAGRKWLEDG
jgi:1-acyl-sn-glycerol-3-phosphate acyltransferase